MSDTPRTDAFKGKCQSYHKNEHGRTLIEESELIERELSNMTDQRDAAIEALYWARKNHKLEIAEVKSTHSMSSVCRELRQELADARKLFESSKRARQSLSDACDHLQRELTEALDNYDGLQLVLAATREDLAEAREQRDKLRIIYSEIIASVRVNFMRGMFQQATQEQIDEWCGQQLNKMPLKGGQP